MQSPWMFGAPCKQTDDLGIPEPDPTWTCGLEITGNFNCPAGAHFSTCYHYICTIYTLAPKPYNPKPSSGGRLLAGLSLRLICKRTLASFGRRIVTISILLHAYPSQMPWLAAGGILSTVPTVDWVCLDLARPKRGMILASFTCSLSADAPCLLTGKAFRLLLLSSISLYTYPGHSRLKCVAAAVLRHPSSSARPHFVRASPRLCQV
jgi:hypothetical protein